MKKIFSAIIFLFAFLSVRFADAQAIRFDYLGFSGTCTRYTKPFFWGIGYEQNLGDKICVGLTYKGGYGLDDEFSQESYYSFIGTDAFNSDHIISFSVYHRTNWNEFAYTSKYFFTDNTDGGYYIASGIGLLQAKNEYEVHSLMDDFTPVSNYKDIFQGTYEQKIILLPVSLDLGGRGEFDGFYFEYYLGMGFLPFGSGGDIEPAFLPNHGVETRFQSVSFHMGLSFGVSWAD